MPYDEVQQPIPCPNAFGDRSSSAAQSQAALLLLLGRQLRGDEQALLSRAAAAGRERYVDLMPIEDVEAFPLPQLRSVGQRSIDVLNTEAQLRQRYGIARRMESQAKLLGNPEVLLDLAKRLYKRQTVTAAVELMEASLQHDNELVQVAAASSFFHLSTRSERLLNILVKGTRSEDELVRNVAATAMSHIAPEHARLQEMTISNTKAAHAGSTHTSLLVHGTFARQYSWWKSGGDFHTYLVSSVRNDLYSGGDAFEWSGGYSDNARSIGAADLVQWVAGHNLMGLDLFAHSHGGSVVMLASNTELSGGELVLLSCPVHVHKYMPNFSTLRKIVSIHVHMDLVILADRGGLRFKHTKIKEKVIPVWYNHSATHDPSIWQKYDVPSLL